MTVAWCWVSGHSQLVDGCMKDAGRTPLIVQLLEDLADDLADTLQRLDVLLCLVVLLL